MDSPRFSLWSDVPQQNRLLKVLILCAVAPPLACREPAPPPGIYLPVALDSLLRRSYLSESGCFSVSRIAVLLLFDLQMDLQVFAIFR